MRNVHERTVEAAPVAVGALLDRLGAHDDRLWPAPDWPPLRLDRPLGVGAHGGHGPVRYAVSAYQPGRRVEFTFAPGLGLVGTHALEVEPLGEDRTRLRHVLEGRTTGRLRLLWPLAIRWLHDALIEDLLDRAEQALGTGPARPARQRSWVRLLRAALVPRPRAVPVPDTPLLRAALPRVDWSDAFAVPCPPGAPTDAQLWADAVFRDPPPLVRRLLAFRNRLVPLLGIAPGDASAFATLAARDGEVLLGTDAGHLDFRASVLVGAAVTLSTLVRVHGIRGRVYMGVVGVVHPFVVRSMLRRASRRLAGARPSAEAVPAAG